MNKATPDSNIDWKTVDHFGQEWSTYDQSELSEEEAQWSFEQYFAPFPWDSLASDAEGFDLGCGSGRWAILAAPRVGRLHCIDPAEAALNVCRKRLANCPNVAFHLASSDAIPLDDGSQDFGYSLGVLHHIPDTAKAMADAVRKLRPGAPFLVYLYYDFENRPAWFRWLWRGSEVGRAAISRLPFVAKKGLTTAIAATIYWPLSRAARLLEKAGMNVSDVPLSAYRHRAFYSLRTDALDRFGTRLEQRFSRADIRAMMEAAGLEDIVFSDSPPFWVACGRRGASPAGKPQGTRKARARAARQKSSA
jgi:ubiquinone/menaquinone biosynthesis C-methylase UbiE